MIVTGEPSAFLASPATLAMRGMHSNCVRFSVLALSSIFFPVGPFAAIPAFLDVTANAEPARRKRMARKAALASCIVLISSASLSGMSRFLWSKTLCSFASLR